MGCNPTMDRPFQMVFVVFHNIQTVAVFVEGQPRFPKREARGANLTVRPVTRLSIMARSP